MDNNENHSEGRCSVCQSCGMHGGRCQGHFGHILVKFIIAVFIFWCGVQFGELKGMLHDGYGNLNYRMMGSYGETNQNQLYYGGPAMMYGAYGSAQALPATTTRK